MFDNITGDDLIMSFFPCIYFTGWTNPCYFTLENVNYRGLTLEQKFEKMLERSDNRNYFFKLIFKMVAVCLMKGLRIVIENPFSTQHYLVNNFLKPADLIDKDRTRRGDYMKKPTQYWFFNCEPTYGESFQKPEKKLKVEDLRGNVAGLCSEERSMISPDYARNFICDFILGKPQSNSQLMLF